MMETKKAIYLAFLTSLLATTAFAEEYMPTKVSYKAREIKSAPVVEHEVDDYYKFETGMKEHERSIASEEPKHEPAPDSERTPSSMKPHDQEKKKQALQKESDKPQPWYQNGKREAHTKSFSEF